MAKKKKKLWIIAIVVIALAAASIWYFTKTNEIIYSDVVAQTGTIEMYYNFDGTINAPHKQTLTSPVTDTVREVYVSQNDQVKKGDRLLKLSGGETIKSDIDGEVTGLLVSRDDAVTAGMTVVQIINLDRLEVEMKVDEYDIGAIEIGKPAQVTVNAITGKVIDAVVEKVNKTSTMTGDLSYYTVTLSFDAAHNVGLLPGMQVSVNLLNQKAESATILPMSALRFDRFNQPYVLMREGDEVKEVSLSVGINDGTNVEILSGVRSGESVLAGDKTRMTMSEMREMMMDGGM